MQRYALVAAAQAFRQAHQMKRLAKVVTLIVAVLPITGCQRLFDLQIVGVPTEPDFILSPFQGALIPGPMPAVDNVEVVEASDRGRTVWEMSRDPKCAPTSHFRYGETPPEWHAWTKPEPLQPGVTYVVDMSGCGFASARAFKILRGKLVSAEGGGDAPVKSIEAMK